jgi:hypothetical protein
VAVWACRRAEKRTEPRRKGRVSAHSGDARSRAIPAIRRMHVSPAAAGKLAKGAALARFKGLPSKTTDAIARKGAQIALRFRFLRSPFPLATPVSPSSGEGVLADLAFGAAIVRHS